MEKMKKENDDESEREKGPVCLQVFEARGVRIQMMMMGLWRRRIQGNGKGHSSTRQLVMQKREILGGRMVWEGWGRGWRRREDVLLVAWSYAYGEGGGRRWRRRRRRRITIFSFLLHSTTTTTKLMEKPLLLLVAFVFCLLSSVFCLRFFPGLFFLFGFCLKLRYKPNGHVPANPSA